MFESLKESFVVWNNKNDDRTKLQQMYIIVALGLLVVAGIVGLLNRELGQNILVAAIVSAAMFLINAVVWSLLQSAILSRLATKRTSASFRKK